MARFAAYLNTLGVRGVCSISQWVNQVTRKVLKERSLQVVHGIGDATHSGAMDLIASSSR